MPVSVVTADFITRTGLTCPVCNAPVRETAAWRMGQQTVHQIVCQNGHSFRAYERENGSYGIVLYGNSTRRDTTTATATTTQTQTTTQTESTVTATIENGRWAFVDAPTISIEQLKKFMTHLKAGLELELDYKPNANAEDVDIKTEQFFGMRITRYHEVPSCPVCGRLNCWVHIPEKLVRSIERDGSIYGNEFLIYGSGEPSEDFATQLKPVIEFLSQNYQVTWKDSCHVHLLVADDYSPVPVTVPNNFWQLVRYFYPGYAWIFGNTPGSFLRRSGYSGFQDILASPLLNHVGVTRNAVYFGESYIQRNKIIIFNIENRLADASLNLKQLVALRAVNLALMKRAAELALVGLIKVDNDKWPIYKGLGQIINDLVWSNISPEQVDMNLVKQWMKRNAEEMLDEIKHLLSPFEYAIVKELIENPPREAQNTTNAEINIPTKRMDKQLIQAIINAPAMKTEKESITAIAKALGKTEETVKKELEKLGAKWVNGRFKVVA